MRSKSSCPALTVILTLAVSLAAHAQVPRETAEKPEKKTVPTPKPSEIRGAPTDGLVYVWIPPGTFTMGCSPHDYDCDNNERPAHQVTISKGFWIGQTEVTVAAYRRFAAATGRQMPPDPRVDDSWANHNIQNVPITMVNWDEAQAYCQWAGGRLPTEAEWEYASRGRTPDSRYAPLDQIAWYGDSSGMAIHRVAQRLPNGFGLYDTLGNVWEWVNDWYVPNYYQKRPSSDPVGPASGKYRVLRGGSWRNPAKSVRVSHRFRVLPDWQNDNTGFRCAAELAVTP